MDIKTEFPNVKGYSVRNLKYMAKFAETYPDGQFVQQVATQIPWGQNIVLLDKVADDTIRRRYTEKTVENGWSRNVLVHHIESNLYAGQLNFYLSAVDSILKKEQDNPSIGLLLCKNKNDLVAEYALKDMSKPIGVSDYKITNSLPEEFINQLPSVEDIQNRIKGE